MKDREGFLRNAMEAHGGAVYRLALCRLQNAADAEDVYQDVFLRLLGEEARDWDGEYLKTCTMRKGTAQRRSPPCSMSPRPRCAPGSAGRE